MFWPWFILSFIFIHVVFRFSVLIELQGVSLFLHNFCLSLVPASSTSSETLAALVCGKNLDRLSTQQLYSSTGLIHLFVVSGSHLILIQKFVAQKISLFFMFLLLGSYCAVCLFNPPVTRSFVFLGFTLMIRRHHQYWPKHYVLLLAGLLTLALNFTWLISLSLQMSWLAALVLEISAHGLKNHSALVRQCLFYGIFLFCFMGLGFPQFSTIILCIVMTPVLEFILFPLAILTVLFHFLEPVFTYTVFILNTILQSLEFHSQASDFSLPTLMYLNWITIMLGHFFLFSRKVRT